MIVTIWKPSLIDAHTFINEFGLSSQFVQFIKDDSQRGWWIVLNSNSRILEQLKEMKPKQTIIW